MHILTYETLGTIHKLPQQTQNQNQKREMRGQKKLPSGARSTTKEDLPALATWESTELNSF